MPSKERRGKWQAYDALEGYKQSLWEAEAEREKIEKPVLLPDKVEEMDRILNSAWEEARELKITYYQAGRLLKIAGRVERIDLAAKRITVGGISLKLKDIIDIEE
jgi:hypothetical protein